MNSFEENIKKHQLLQKSFAETFTGQNEVFKIVEALKKAGVPEDEMVEKAKYIRREGTKGNYKYIYEESTSDRHKRQVNAITGSEKDGHVSKLLKKLKDANRNSNKSDKKEEDITTEDIKNLSSKEKLNLALEGNAAAQRALDYGEYQYFLTQREKMREQEQHSEKKDSTQNKEELKELVIQAKSRYDKYNEAFISNPERSESFMKKMKEAEDSYKDILNQYKTNKSQYSDLQKAEQTEAQKDKIAKVMREFKEGKLKSSSGEVVKDKEQAIAIALSEAGLSKSEFVDLLKARSGIYTDTPYNRKMGRVGQKYGVHTKNEEKKAGNKKENWEDSQTRKKFESQGNFGTNSKNMNLFGYSYSSGKNDVDIPNNKDIHVGKVTTKDDNKGIYYVDISFDDGGRQKTIKTQLKENEMLNLGFKK